jgi:hypothetical protein
LLIISTNSKYGITKSNCLIGPFRVTSSMRLTYLLSETDKKVNYGAIASVRREKVGGAMPMRKKNDRQVVSACGSRDFHFKVYVAAGHGHYYRTKADDGCL